VHSDLNPKNLLVDPETLEVRGVLDWEFAHAGCPVVDIGNLLRFDREPAFADAVLEVYRDRVPDASGDLLERARAADLWALIELASRRGENPVTERADAHLRAIARTGDIHALPG
jgi:aminoglycoside phosphotransferase (APT) family kinase protein